MFAELLSLKDFAKFATSNDLGRLKTDMLSWFIKIHNIHLYLYYGIVRILYVY